MRFKRVFWHHRFVHILCVDVREYANKIFVLTFEHNLKSFSIDLLFLRVTGNRISSNVPRLSPTKRIRKEILLSHHTSISKIHSKEVLIITLQYLPNK